MTLWLVLWLVTSVLIGNWAAHLTGEQRPAAMVGCVAGAMVVVGLALTLVARQV
jgi:hypothetical protein